MLESLFKSAEYFDFESFVTYCRDLLKEGKTTSNNDDEQYLHFAKLNLQRMERLWKTITIPTDIKDKLKNLNSQNWWIITEGWCGDSAQILPVLAKMELENPNIQLKIILRDKYPQIMDHYLTNGSRSIPILIIFENGEEIAKWGPRPEGAVQVANQYKANKDKITFEEFEVSLQQWYNKDKGQQVMQEVIAKSES